MNLSDKFNEFYNKYNGVANTGDTPENMGQCVGLVEVWTDFLGLPHEFGNAKDLLANADPKYFDIIQNTLDNVPNIGDIMVWGVQVGEFGHTAIFGDGDINTFNSFDQNWPLNSPPHNQDHNYSGVLGWLSPKVVIQSPIVEMPQYLQGLFQAQGLDANDEGKVRTFWQGAIDYPHTLNDLNNCKTQITLLNNQISGLDTQVKGLQLTNSSQADRIAELEKELQNALQSPNFSPKSPLGKLFYSLAQTFS